MCWRRNIFSYSAKLQINYGEASVLSVSEFPLLPKPVDFFLSWFSQHALDLDCMNVAFRMHRVLVWSFLASGNNNYPQSQNDDGTQVYVSLSFKVISLLFADYADFVHKT